MKFLAKKLAARVIKEMYHTTLGVIAIAWLAWHYRNYEGDK